MVRNRSDELVEQECVDAVGRGDARDQEERRALPEDAVGHPVARAIPAADLGRGVVARDLRAGNPRGPGRGARSGSGPIADSAGPGRVALARLQTRVVRLASGSSRRGLGGAWNAMLAKLTQQVRRSSRA